MRRLQENSLRLLLNLDKSFGLVGYKMWKRRRAPAEDVWMDSSLLEISITKKNVDLTFCKTVSMTCLLVCENLEIATKR